MAAATLDGLDRRRAALEFEIDRWQQRGYIVMDRTDTTAQLRKPKRFSLVWFVLVSLTGIGLVVYPLYHLFLKRDQYVYLSVDEAYMLHTRQQRA